jgi:hypothetical protein
MPAPEASTLLRAVILDFFRRAEVAAQAEVVIRTGGVVALAGVLVGNLLDAGEVLEVIRIEGLAVGTG